MKIALVALQDDLNAYGVRCLSSALRARGFSVRVVYLDRHGARGAARAYRAGVPPLGERIHEAVARACAGCDLVGISVMSLYLGAAAALTAHLRRTVGVPILWGGIHPLCDPEGSLLHADAIALGESEETIVEAAERYASGRDLAGVAGLWFRRGGEIVSNPVRQPPDDLDRFPPPDIGLEDHHRLAGERIVPLTREDLLAAWNGIYMTIDARGCPLRCTYCCNAQLAGRFDWTRVRARSVPMILEELEAAVARYPEIRGVKLSDDAFGDLPPEYIRDFARGYADRIRRPLGIPGWSPQNLSAEKLAPLVSAGLEYVRLGVQSGSPRIRRLYGRTESNDRIVDAVATVQSFRPRIRRLKIDVITDNPWETKEDRAETVRLLLRLSRPYALALFSLTLFPGTPLHRKARREGLLSGDGPGAPGLRHFNRLDPDDRYNRILSLFRKEEILPERIEDLLDAADSALRFEPAYWSYLAALPRRAPRAPSEALLW